MALAPMATAFVSVPGQPVVTAAPVATPLRSSQPAPPSSHGLGAQAFCSGLAVGLVGAGASMRAGRSSMQAGFDASKQIGVMPPTGYWDPCGCLKERVGKDGWQWKDEATFDKYRAAELKHGRVAMVASVGLIANAWWKLPGFESVPDGLAALQTPEGGAGFGILFILAGYFELTNPYGKFTDPAGWRALMVDDDHVLQSKELANCRMAMMAVVTLWIIEYGTGISPTSQMTNLDLLIQPSWGTGLAFLALPASGVFWDDAVKDPAWPFKETRTFSAAFGPAVSNMKATTTTIAAKLPEQKEAVPEQKEAVEEEIETSAAATTTTISAKVPEQKEAVEEEVEASAAATA